MLRERIFRPYFQASRHQTWGAGELYYPLDSASLLLAALGAEAEPKKKAIRYPREDRIIAEFEEIKCSIEEHGQRIANAENDPTFLLAPVEVVATYHPYNINRIKLEKLLHKFFDSAKLDIQIKDRFGKPVVPREWFFVPLFIVDQVVEKLRDGSLGDYYYDAETVAMLPVN